MNKNGLVLVAAIIKQENELSKISMNFIDRLNYAEHKIFCVCIDVYKIYEGKDFDELYEVLPILKNKKLKNNNIIFEKYKNMNEFLDFVQSY